MGKFAHIWRLLHRVQFISFIGQLVNNEQEGQAILERKANFTVKIKNIVLLLRLSCVSDTSKFSRKFASGSKG